MSVMNNIYGIKGILLVVIGMTWQFVVAQDTGTATPNGEVLALDPSSVAVSNDHRSAYNPLPYLERWRVVTDLNGDGTNDLILSDTIDTFGNAGGVWEVYINSNGCWRCIGDVGLHPGALTLDSVHGGVDLWYYSHCSAQEGYIGYYSFSPDGMSKSINRMFVRTDGDDGNVTDGVFNTVFGLAHRHPYHLDISETTTNGVVMWKTMGDWRKPSREDVISELKRKLAKSESRARTAEEELKQVTWRLDMLERDLLDISGVALGSKWKGEARSLACPEVFDGFTNMTVRVDKHGYVESVRLVRRLSENESGIEGGRFPSDEEQKIIHQAENHFHVRFDIDTYPGTYKWSNPFERVRIRIDFRDKAMSVIEADYMKSFTE